MASLIAWCTGASLVTAGRQSGARGHTQCAKRGARTTTTRRTHEGGPAVNSLRAERERGRKLDARADAAAREERDLEAARREREQHEVAHVVLAGVARTLEAVDGEEVGAHALRRLRVADGHALVDDQDAGALERGDELARVVARRFHDGDALVDDDLAVRLVVGRNQCG